MTNTFYINMYLAVSCAMLPRQFFFFFAINEKSLFTRLPLPFC